MTYSVSYVQSLRRQIKEAEKYVDELVARICELTKEDHIPMSVAND